MKAPFWLGTLNYFVLQWFFVRLQAVGNVHTKKVEKWELLRWVVPLTGWDSNYVFLRK